MSDSSSSHKFSHVDWPYVSAYDYAALCAGDYTSVAISLLSRWFKERVPPLGVPEFVLEHGKNLEVVARAYYYRDGYGGWTSEREVVGERNGVRCVGILDGVDGESVVEFKCPYWRAGGLKPRYVRQVSWYGWLVGLKKARVCELFKGKLNVWEIDVNICDDCFVEFPMVFDAVKELIDYVTSTFEET